MLTTDMWDPAAWTLFTMIMKISEEFKKRVTEDYKADTSWVRITSMLDENNDLDKNAATLPFQYNNSSLIYYKDLNQGDHFCIPSDSDLISNIFQLVYNKLSYQGY